jgi:hypothetical protein
MLHLLAEPKSLAEAAEPSRRDSLFGLCVEGRPGRPLDRETMARIIAGGSDADRGDHSGRVSSGLHVNQVAARVPP